MRKVYLYAAMALSILFAALAVVGGAIALLMMVVGDCGVNVFNRPDWPLQLVLVTAIPAAIVFSAIKFFRYCSGRLLLVH